MSDIWDSANDATREPRGPKTRFGQVFTDGHYVYISFKKGEPRILFDPNQHPIEGRHTLVNIDAVCTTRDGASYEIHKEMVCELDAEWQITKVSLKTLGVHPRDLNERWAKWTMAETGETYTNDYGEQKATTFKFLEFYPDEATCRAAETAHYSRSNDSNSQSATSSNLDSTHPMPQETPEEDKSTSMERANAAIFLPTIWTLSKKDPEAFYAAIKNQPSLAAHFDSNSAEVAAIVAGETA